MRGERKGVDEWRMKYNFDFLWAALMTLVYGVHMIDSRTYLRISEPPIRYFIIATMLTFSILSLISLMTKSARFKGWMLLLLTMNWSWVGMLYWLSPVVNGGWILALGIVGFCLLILIRGDWRSGR